MKVIHMPESGREFIPYTIVGNNIDFNDGEITINLSKKERDYEVTVDVCTDYTGGLVCGTADGVIYVAQVVIPAREYTETEILNSEGNDEDGTISETIAIREPVPFDIDQCELKLW